MKPSQKIKSLKNLSLKFPLSIFISLVIIKYFICKKLPLFYLITVASLPLCSYILINKIIIEKYYSMKFITQNYIIFNDFFKLFFTGYIPFIIFCYLTFIIKLTSKVGHITNYLSIAYSTYIAGKLTIFYLKNLPISNKEKEKRYFSLINDDGKTIYFIYFIIYWLISYIFNL